MQNYERKLRKIKKTIKNIVVVRKNSIAHKISEVCFGHVFAFNFRKTQLYVIK